MRLVRTWLPVIVWAAVILCGVERHVLLRPEPRLAGRARSERELARALNFAVRKLGHVLGYGILGALAWRADRRVAVALGVVLLVASVDEYRQSLSLTRSGTGWDVLLDLCSALLVILAIRRR